MRCCSYNLQTSLVLLIPNCTRQRMITYTNPDLSKLQREASFRARQQRRELKKNGVGQASN